MIYDCFLYSGEKELLEIRINELSLCNDFVTHLIVESNKTHTGWDKPLYFEQQKEHFKKYPNIMYFVVDDMPENATAREREKHQRNCILKMLEFNQIHYSDIIIVSDVDEIPRAKQIDKFKPNMEFAALIQDKYNYYLNLLEGYQIWNRAKIMTWKHLVNSTPEEVRNSGYDFSIHDAGFHFSWLGGAEKAVQKLESFSHTELNTPENIEKVKMAENIWDDTKFKVVDIDLSFPEYIVKNIDNYKHLIK